MADVLKVGDKVRWRGAWGRDAEQIATVKSITQTEHAREKYGWQVDELEWSQRDYMVVTLDTPEGSRWAYGYQVSAV
jgi:hypothetical protein